MENSQSRARYSDLPRELLILIGKRLDTSVDILRFRSVCRSWRASLPKSNAVSLLSRLRLCSPNSNDRDVYLIRRIIYSFSPLGSLSSSSPSMPPSWLALVESTKFGKIRFRDLISLQVHHYSNNRPLQANWLDLRFHEVARSYSLECFNIGSDVEGGVTKVVLSPDSVWTDRSTWTIVAIYSKGKLGFVKHGDKNWTLIDNRNFNYDDLIVYNRRIWAVNRPGMILLINSSMKLVRIPSALPSGNQKHLVECDRGLYLVEGLTGDFVRDSNSDPSSSEIGFGMVPTPNGLTSGIGFVYFTVNVIGSSPSENDSPSMKVLAPSKSVINFKVYRLFAHKREIIGKELKDLGDHAFVLGKNGCFSITAPNSVGLEQNCIYFESKFDIGLNENHAYKNTFAFNLKERRIYEDNMVRTAPIWLVQNSN